MSDKNVSQPKGGQGRGPMGGGPGARMPVQKS